MIFTLRVEVTTLLTGTELHANIETMVWKDYFNLHDDLYFNIEKGKFKGIGTGQLCTFNIIIGFDAWYQNEEPLKYQHISCMLTLSQYI